MTWAVFKSFSLCTLATLMLQAYSFAQNTLTEVTNIKGQFVDDHTSLYSLNTCIHDSVVYTITRYPTGGKRYIYAFDLKTQKSNSFEILEDKKKKKVMGANVYGVEYINKNVVLLSSNDIFVLESQRSGDFKLVKTLKNEYNFNTVKPFGDKLFLYIDYKFHPFDAKYRHVWAYFNPATLDVENIKIQPEENTWLSFFVNSWVDVYHDKIAYASTTEYKVRILDKDFRVVDSIATDELKENESYLAEFKSLNTESKDGISELWEKDTKHLYRIRNVYFLDDSTISVILKLPAQDSVVVNYWQKQNGIWHKTKTDRSPTWLAEGAAYSQANITYRDFWQNIFDLPYLGNGNFCLVYYPYIPTIQTKKFDKNKDYLELQNEAIKTQNTHFGIKIIHTNPGTVAP